MWKADHEVKDETRGICLIIRQGGFIKLKVKKQKFVDEFSYPEERVLSNHF